jgi:hypothetical protein
MFGSAIFYPAILENEEDNATLPLHNLYNVRLNL